MERVVERRGLGPFAVAVRRDVIGGRGPEATSMRALNDE